MDSFKALPLDRNDDEGLEDDEGMPKLAVIFLHMAFQLHPVSLLRMSASDSAFDPC